MNQKGACFLCLVDVVPVKNEDGVVIMFILNFEVMPDDKLHDPQDLNHKLPVLWRHTNRARGIRLRLPLLNSRNNSKSSLREDPEAGRGTGFPSSSRPQSHESLALGELLSLPEHEPPRLPTASSTAVATPSSLLPEDQCNLLGTDPSSPPPAPPHPAALPLGHSSPRPHRLNPDASVSNCSLTNSRSRESFHSMRRASSVDDIAAMRPEWDRKHRTRPTSSSTGAMNNKSSILNSTSDSDLMRYRAISKIPQITLNFVDFKPDPLIALPAGEMDIIAPCKLIDRTHNVTEKVTQVTHFGHAGAINLNGTGVAVGVGSSWGIIEIGAGLRRIDSNLRCPHFSYAKTLIRTYRLQGSRQAETSRANPSRQDGGVEIGQIISRGNGVNQRTFTFSVTARED
ncbi:potassium voltage-gated channel subfamily H member 2-like protein [Labeo rohita]|uniref:Potassium voltage-gated channel subfamily H member 2-like protein n=1 Tax=Labeo rohita TaxID=84645 RepID=A0A498MCN7_LABRO|nr:potassium voltage-gated channel subfamily H member 2-like protein [Labeo rohita]